MVKVKLKRLKSELLSRALDKMKLKLLEVTGSLYIEDNDQSHWLYLVPDYYWLNPYSYDTEEDIFSFNGMQILKGHFVYKYCNYCGVLRGTSETDILEKLMNNEELFFEDPRDQDLSAFKFKSIAYGKTPEQLEIELDLDGEDNGQR
jgi:hypothetical protein